MDATSALLTPTASRIALPQPAFDAGRVRDIVLVRVATAGKVLMRADLARDLHPVVSHLLSLAEWTSVLDRDLGALADAGLCEAKAVAVSVTEPGRKRAALVLGVNTLPRTWNEAKHGRLIAKALGAEQLPPRRLKFLRKAEGLRAAIVQHAFKLKLRGIPTPARLRAQLAKLALSRAFADTLPEDSDGRSGLSAKAGRNLAGRLAHPPRDFATDSRLIAALAIESAGATKGDLESLQTALLRRYVTRGQIAAQPCAVNPERRSKRIAPPKAAVAHAAHPVSQLSVVPANAKPSAQLPQRADFANFVTSVRHLAEGLAEGWPGNRKAYVSKVWTAAQAQYPAWRVSEIEFKAMLAEAHRLGHIVLANADLKDQRSMAEIQASAIAYKNAIFHYVRVDD